MSTTHQCITAVDDDVRVDVTRLSDGSFEIYIEAPGEDGDGDEITDTITAALDVVQLEALQQAIGAILWAARR